MTRVKANIVKGALTAVLAAGAIGATTAPASADVACNRYHECWNVRDHVNYPARAHVVYHGDDWRRSHTSHYHWRADHDDHGYYRNGVWIKF